MRDPQTPCIREPQGLQLRTQINKHHPFNAEIVDYEFYENNETGEVGWVFIWKNLECSHGRPQKFSPEEAEDKIRAPMSQNIENQGS